MSLSYRIFVGRQREMAELRAALDDAMSGSGRLVVVAGEPGIGKTRTAQELASLADQQGFQVLWGRCYEGGGAPPYWPWAQAIRAYIQNRDVEALQSEMGAGAADIAEVVPELRTMLPNLEPPPRLDSEQARFRLFDSIATFLKNAASTSPLVIVMDDLHWADASSLMLMQFLAREMGGSRLLVVSAYRDIELSRQHLLSDTLAQLSRESVFRRVSLRGLEYADAALFLEVSTGDKPSDALVRAVYGSTEGNPFFMGEVVRLLAAEGRMAESGDAATLRFRLPEGVREVIGQRLNRLSEPCNRVLTTAAVIGREFDFKALHAVAGVADEEMLDAIDEALAAHVIEEAPVRGERYQFGHALIQQTLYEKLSASRRVRLHARVGEALEALYEAEVETHAAALAYHYSEASELVGTEKLVRYSVAAGEQALAKYAYEEALGYFERALAAKEGQPVDVETAAVLFGLGRAQAARGDGEAALTSMSRAFDYYAAVDNIPQAMAVARECPLVNMDTLFIRFIPDSKAAHLIERALALAPPDSLDAGWLLCHYGLALSQNKGDYQGAQEALSQSLLIAHREEDTALEMRVLSNIAYSNFWHTKDLQGSVHKSLRVIELAQIVDDPNSEARAHWSILEIIRTWGDLEGARFHAAAMLKAAERLRHRDTLVNALRLNQLVWQAGGDWDSARGFSERGLALAPMSPLLCRYRALLEYQLGNFSEGRRYLERFLSNQAMNHQHTAELIAVIARLTNVIEHLEAVETAIRIVFSAPSVAHSHDRARIGLGLIAALKGDTKVASEQYSILASRGEALPPWVEISNHRTLALLAQAAGQHEKGANHFEDALAFCRSAGYRPELAWTCYDYAAMLVGASPHAPEPALSSPKGQTHRSAPTDVEKALSLLVEALDIATALGMKPLMEKVAVLKESIGAIRWVAPAYPGGLTEREVEVLRLAAQGRTDREIAGELFISVRTVGNHVRSILNKTGSANRTEAASYATRHGLV